MIHKKWMLRDILNNSIPIFVLYLFALIIGCTSGPDAYRLANKNNTNITNLEKSHIGMTKTEVLTLMGPANKSEKFERQGVHVEILYYLTSGSYSPSMGWQNISSTPVVFEAGILKGWGKYYDEQRLGSPRMPKEQSSDNVNQEDNEGQPIRSAGGYDDKIIAKESTRAKQYSEKDQSEQQCG